MQLVSNDVTIEILIATADSYQYAGKFLLESQCSGNEAGKHQRAVDLITANFVELDKRIVAHPGFSAWKVEQEALRAKQKADLAAAQEAAEKK